MEKFPSLKLEVIHFYTEDVIVTSGTGQLSQSNFVFSPPYTYFTLGRELNDAGYNDANQNLFYKYIPNSKSNSFEYDKYTSEKYTNIRLVEKSWRYAWYNDNRWHTENQTKDYFLDNDILWTN